MMTGLPHLAELNERSREVLRLVVEEFVETGEPIGSRTLSKRLASGISPATIRNVLSDLEDIGLLFAPHTSAGRLPTDNGLRLFVDGLLEMGNISDEERQHIKTQCAAAGRSVTQILEEASGLISGLSNCASFVVAPKTEARLKHIEFINLGPGRALAILVDEKGMVENRLIELPPGILPSSLIEAGNYLSARMVGRNLSETTTDIENDIAQNKTQLNQLSSKVVEAGLATWGNSTASDGVLIVRGQSHLLDDISGLAELEKIRNLFQVLETKETLIKLLSAAQGGDGIQIFIGAENEMFTHTGCSMVISPYTDDEKQIVGAIGVIGPTRMNYARIVPMVDYTSRIVGRLLR
jgi:heat-inducible transcriptional repressor